MSCQLKDIIEIGQKNWWFNNLLQTRVKILRQLKRDLVYLKNVIARFLMSNSKGAPESSSKKISISPGDTVRERSKAEIKSLLDDRDKQALLALMNAKTRHEAEAAINTWYADSYPDKD